MYLIYNILEIILFFPTRHVRQTGDKLFSFSPANSLFHASLVGVSESTVYNSTSLFREDYKIRLKDQELES